MSACWPLQMPATQKAVLISLADNASDDGHCWPSIPTISERTCFSVRAVIDAIKALEEYGIVTANRDNGRHTKYVIRPEKFDPEKAKPRSRGFVYRSETTAEPVQMPHGCSARTSAANAPEPMQMPHKPVREMHSNRQEPSLNRQGGASKSSAPQRTFSSWLKSLPPDEIPIPETDPVFRFAERAGIPDDLLELAWIWFERTYGASGARASKRQSDWRRVFRNAVEGNWPKIWFAKPEGGYGITTVGIQLQRAMHGEAA